MFRYKSLIVLGVATALVIAQPHPIAAWAETQPPTSYSFYVEVQNNSAGANEMDTLGCNQAHADNSNATNSMVNLDFGALNVTGSGDQEEINNNELTPTGVETLAEWFING
jgi:hypothetical protein